MVDFISICQTMSYGSMWTPSANHRYKLTTYAVRVAHNIPRRRRQSVACITVKISGCVEVRIIGAVELVMAFWLHRVSS